MTLQKPTVKKLNSHSPLDSSVKRPGLTIQDLPPEMLYETFTYFRSCIGFDENSSKLCSPVFPLTWVCSYWRALLLSRVEFWNQFRLSIMCITDRGGAGIPDFLIQCISRARDAHLLVKLADCGPDDDLDNEPNWVVTLSQRRVLDAFISKASTWHSVGLYSYRTEWSNSAMRYLSDRLGEKTDFLALDRLQLDSPDVIFPAELTRIFQRCPRLRALDTPSLLQNAPNNLLVLNLSTYDGTPSLAEILMQWPSLQTLSLWDREDLGPPRTERAPNQCHHSQLSRLGVFIHSRSTFAVCDWRPLWLPGLKELVVVALDYKDERLQPPASIEELKAMVVRSRCVLERVSLYSFPGKTATQFLDAISSALTPDTTIASLGECDFPVRPPLTWL